MECETPRYPVGMVQFQLLPQEAQLTSNNEIGDGDSRLAWDFQIRKTVVFDSVTLLLEPLWATQFCELLGRAFSEMTRWLNATSCGRQWLRQLSARLYSVPSAIDGGVANPVAGLVRQPQSIGHINVYRD